MMCDVSMFPYVWFAAIVSPGRLLLRVRVGILMFTRPCARIAFCTPLAPRPASRRVVAAPRRCVASCAGIKILSRELAKPCISELSVLPRVEVSLTGGDRRCKKMVFLAAIREKSQRWIALRETGLTRFWINPRGTRSSNLGYYGNGEEEAGPSLGLPKWSLKACYLRL